MSRWELAFCRGAPWRLVARTLVLPWTLMGERLSGSVLEIGCGTGAMAAQILRRFPTVSLTATDVDPRMVERAREVLSPFEERAALQHADATALPYSEAEYDAVISILMLHHVGAWERALAEATRVLKPGGLLLVSDLLDGRLLRATERLAGSAGVRPMSWSGLHAVLRELPLTDVRARRTGRALVRLRTAKEHGLREDGGLRGSPSPGTN